MPMFHSAALLSQKAPSSSTETRARAGHKAATDFHAARGAFADTIIDNIGRENPPDAMRESL